MACADFFALDKWLSYCPETGHLTWRVSPMYRVQAGDIAGCPNKRGYIAVKVAGTRNYAHRIAWLLTHQEWPAAVIDHIDGDRTNNRLSNLRSTTQQLNVENVRGPTCASTTGFLGVGLAKDGCFKARIKAKGKLTQLGTFSTAEAAYSAYLTAKRRLHAGCTI